jgi:hypothetical protein
VKRLPNIAVEILEPTGSPEHSQDVFTVSSCPFRSIENTRMLQGGGTRARLAHRRVTDGVQVIIAVLVTHRTVRREYNSQDGYSPN